MKKGAFANHEWELMKILQYEDDYGCTHIWISYFHSPGIQILLKITALQAEKY